MKLLRFTALVFILILAFQFVNIRYFGGAIFSLSSEDKFPVSIDVSTQVTEPIRPLSDPERLNFTSSRSAEVDEEERAGLEEDHVIDSDKNDIIQSHDSFVEDAKDKETLGLLLGTRNGSNGSDENMVEDADMVSENSRKVEILETGSDPSVDNLSPEVKRFMKVSNSEVVSITEMMNLLHQSRTYHVSSKLKRSSTVDQELFYARTQIENPPMIENNPLLHGPLYWNLSTFKRSYELMEKKLKVYVYREGKRPVLHKPVLKGIYASEGWFMKQLKST